MKNNHSNGNHSEFRPTWYLALLVWPAITALMFIVAGSAGEQPSNLAQVKPAVSATTPVVVADARDGKTTAR